MIQLYTWGTPNGRKISIMLEEASLPYQVTPVDITSDEQFQPSFLEISPNNKIPAIVDDQTGISLFESAAILLYLAEKSRRLLPDSGPDRWRTIQWLLWQASGQGPMLGQAHHFLHFNPGKSDYAEERYLNEARRLYSVLERQLAKTRYAATNDLSIADIAIWPWVSRFLFQKIDLHHYPSVRTWYLRLAERPSFQAGYRVPDPEQEIPVP